MRLYGAILEMNRTFAYLAGADPTDHAAAAAGLPPVDSINLWPYLSGETATSPRKRIPIGSTTCEGGFTEGCINQWGWGNVKTIVQGLIEDRGSEGIWKFMTGANPMNGWQGPLCEYWRDRMRFVHMQICDMKQSYCDKPHYPTLFWQ